MLQRRQCRNVKNVERFTLKPVQHVAIRPSCSGRGEGQNVTICCKRRKEESIMEQNEEVLDSPVGWVAKHIRTYVESGGTQGLKYMGRDTLLLTTRGRKTGKLRRTALFYGRDGERYVLVGSNGGKADDPLWYRNLLAEPRVEVQ